MVEIVQTMDTPEEPEIKRIRPLNEPPLPIDQVSMYSGEKWHKTPVFQRHNLQPNDVIIGPALIVEPTGTNVIEIGWQGKINQFNHLIFEKSSHH